MQKEILPGSLFAAASHNTRVATVNQAALHIFSIGADYSARWSLLHSIALEPAFAAHCNTIRFFRAPASQTSHTSQDESARILLASDNTIHVYDALNPGYHAVVRNAASPSAQLSTAVLVSADELLTMPDHAPKTMLWDLRTGTGMEVRDPKIGLRGNGHSIRPESGHVALLTRPESAAQRDVVVMLGSGQNGVGREVEVEFVLDTYDARGIRWSPDGKWILVWDAASMGPSLWIYTAVGQLYKRWDDAGGGEDEVGLGIEKADWDMEGRLCIGMTDGRIVLLNTATFSHYATLYHHNVIESTPSSASIHEEQLINPDPTSGSSNCTRSFAHAALPAAPPPALPSGGTSQAASGNSVNGDLPKGVSHMVPSHMSPLIASVCSTTPTTVRITTLSPKVRTRAIIIHQSPIKSLEWHPQRPGWLLIQCSAPSSLQASEPNPKLRNEHTAYVWSEDLPDPLIVSVLHSTFSKSSTSSSSSRNTSTNSSSRHTTTLLYPPSKHPQITASWLATDPTSEDAIPHILFSSSAGALSLSALPSSPISSADQTSISISLSAEPTAKPPAQPHQQKHPPNILPSPQPLLPLNLSTASALNTPTPAPRLLATGTTKPTAAIKPPPPKAAATKTRTRNPTTKPPIPTSKRPLTASKPNNRAHPVPAISSKLIFRKTPIKGHGPEPAFDEGASQVDIDLDRSIAASTNASVDWNQGMGFSPVKFDAGEWTRDWSRRVAAEEGGGGVVDDEESIFF